MIVEETELPSEPPLPHLTGAKAMVSFGKRFGRPKVSLAKSRKTACYWVVHVLECMQW